MKLKLRKIGNSYGVILPSDVLQALHVREGSTLNLLPSGQGRGFQLTAEDEQFERKLALLRDTVKRYKNALRELAK
jgi:putative addiction module antidote